MAVATEPAGAISYEGPSPDTEFLGFSQANFLVTVPGWKAREVAILLNAPAARRLLAELGREDTSEARDQLARLVGEAWLKRVIEGRAPFESIVTVSNGFLDEHPDLLAEVRAAAKTS
ncbi:hypothetical protein [Tepidiforma sp.]|uniref:hypothetical protein n=1 Tax=Tepidiforma sp. TaxID=2682230 RepID=UPI002ADD441B|nr:hypothetical protein [Tepidiforma sp.]